MGKLVSISPYCFPGIFIKHIDVMKRVCCLYEGITPEMLIDKTRKRDIVEPRQICIYLMRKELKLTFQHIQAVFNFKTHASVIYAIKNVENMMDTNKQYKNKIIELQ